MGKHRKTRRRRKRGKRPSNTFALVATAMVVIGLLLVVKFWQIVLLCLGGMGLLVLLYVAFRIARRRKKKSIQRTEIVRDSRYIPPQLRQAVWERCDGRCVQCQSMSLLEYDHILPLSKGGATSYGNLQILCRTCNRHKSDHI